ncbi:DUF805 domain-containing protein [Staphylococcus argensis]|uniref:DUF805 domain-containing protein n=1 Tax=Staphylococcus argensis TaxID=1607738 RepID=UPI0011A26A40|nr:DUF805 domain-containing protein [Staphylococcus argensis]
MLEDYKAFWQYYIDFKGESTRQNFWVPMIIHIIVVFVVALLGLMSFLTGVVALSATLFALIGLLLLATIIPTIALTVRRFHDAGRTTRSALILIIVMLLSWFAFDLSRHDALAIVFALIMLICFILLLITTLRPTKQDSR